MTGDSEFFDSNLPQAFELVGLMVIISSAVVISEVICAPNSNLKHSQKCSKKQKIYNLQVGIVSGNVVKAERDDLNRVQELELSFVLR